MSWIWLAARDCAASDIAISADGVVEIGMASIIA